jgi:putative ABC transport system permease protein
METLLQDFRYALRMIIKNPGFTAVALLALALGIGANTALFGTVNAIVLRPLPYTEPERLVMIWENNPEIDLGGFDLFPVSAGSFVDWRDQNQVFDQVSIINGARYSLTGLDTPERLGGASVSHNFFELMGVQAERGRAFLQEEDRPGAGRVVVISHGLFERRFGSDPDILGKAMTLDGSSYTIVGVMPAGFGFPRAEDLPSYFQLPPQAEVWTPIGLTAEQINNRSSHNKAAIARLRPHVTLSQAQADLDAIARRAAEQYEEARGFGVTLVPLQEQVVGNVRTALYVLFGAVGFVLLIACANVANLLLARSAARQKEVAIRTALGASRLRIVRQMLTESVVLSVLGGALGLLVAYLGVKALLIAGPDSIPRKHEVGIDAAVLAFTFLVSLATGVLFGVAPAFQATRLSLNEILKEGVRGSSLGAGHNRTRSLLVIGEVSLALVLLVGAGLLVRSFIRLLQVEPGFDPQNVLTVKLELPDSKYSEFSQQTALFKQVIERVKSLPGVTSASACSDLPLSGNEEIDMFTVEGRPQGKTLAETPLADFRFIDHDYFDTMRIRLRSGRAFTDRDTETSPSVVIISQTLAERFWPGEDPIGKRLKAGDYQSKAAWASVVGLVGDVKHSALNIEPRPQLYFPYQQKHWAQMTIVARTAANPANLAAALRDQVWAVDRDQPLTKVSTLEQFLENSISQRRFNVLLLGALSAVAMVMAAVGIYGVISYSVTQRTHEIGVRMALGATPTGVMRLIVRQGMALALVGVGAGLAAALALTRVMTSLLYGVSPTDPLTIIFVPLALTSVALLACYIPARRATRIDPGVALRYE